MSETGIDAQQKRAALQCILKSSEFAGAERLKAFLTYIVEKEIAGDEDKIIGKTILADVYNLGSAKTTDSAAVVRVDANRMRQRLELYYTGEGKNDAIQLCVNKGGYVPRFFHGTALDASDSSDHHASGLSARAIVIAAAFVAVAVTGFFLANWQLLKEDSTVTASEESPQVRTALFENAPSKLVARNTAQEARELLFPATQLIRVSAALSMFEDAIQLDPNYYGSFAGASQASSILAALSPDKTLRGEHFEKEMSYANQAIELDATKAWSHSALAFVYFIDHDFQNANLSSLRGLDLEPNNMHALEMDAVIALFSGEFERAISNADPALHIDRPGSGLPWRNALGNAYFHVGDYAKSIRYLTEAVKAGEPISEINTAHLIASYQASGDLAKANELVKAFEMSWPDSRVSALLLQIFKAPEDAERILVEMKKAGWVDPSTGPDGG